MPKLFAVDPSLTCSGWALFSIKHQSLLAVGKLHSLPPSTHLSLRYKNLQEKIAQILMQLRLGKNDILICEAQTTLKDPRAAFKVEHVRSIFESVARSAKINVPGRINPRSVQSELLGLKGRQAKRIEVKACASNLVQNLFEKELKGLGFNTTTKSLKANQDIVDAILIGYFAIAKVRNGLNAKQSLEEIFTEQKPRRKSNRKSWGSGEDNSFGWSAEEIFNIASGAK